MGLIDIFSSPLYPHTGPYAKKVAVDNFCPCDLRWNKLMYLYIGARLMENQTSSAMLLIQCISRIIV